MKHYQSLEESMVIPSTFSKSNITAKLVVKNMIENPILSGGHPQEDTFEPITLGDCTNVKCNEEIYSGDCIEFGGQFFCNEFCLGTHLVNEGQAIDMSKGY